MTILISNTLSGKKEAFQPQQAPTVSMYVCGVTPYDEVHAGHARAYVTFDIIRRHLTRSGYTVRYIQNFTDIDDKIIRRAAETGVTPATLAGTFIDDYFTQMDRLNIQRADAYPRVTEHIPQIITFIEGLVASGKAYVRGGDVYYAVRKFASYGKLSKRNTDELRAGARVEVDASKQDPLDFALWKKAKPTEPPEASWDSPWGTGRPGWHIECSVMSTGLLGATIDIHGGGQDLIFPHHENEIAQSEAATGKPFVRYWIHNGFVTINKEKMSKSLGNFFTLRDIFATFAPRIVRYFLLTQHYKSPLDFSDDKLREAQRALDGLDEAWRKLTAAQPADAAGPDQAVAARFQAAMDDDFNTEKALAVIHEYKREIMAGLQGMTAAQRSTALRTLNSMLLDGLGIQPPEQDLIPADVAAFAAERAAARHQKNWKQADELREVIDRCGFRMQDNPDGTFTVLKKIS